MGKIIAIANQKGGVGKTTTTVNLGIGLARSGKRVLLIDADGQADLTKSLGFKRPAELSYTTATVLENIVREQDIGTEENLLWHTEDVWLLPSNSKLSEMEMTLVNVMRREFVLSEYIHTIRDNYDYILIDCMPSLGMVTINALVAADSVLIPVQAEYLPVSDLQELIRTVGMVRRHLNKDLDIEGILINRLDNRTRDSKEIAKLLEKNYGSKVTIFKHPVPASVRAAETSAQGKSIYLYDGKGKVANAFAELTKEVMSNG